MCVYFSVAAEILIQDMKNVLLLFTVGFLFA